MRAAPDPYLHVMRANLLMQMQQFDAARAAVHRAIAEEPDLLPARWSLVDIALASKDMALASDALRELAARGEVDFERLRDAPEYEEFVASEHYAKLLASVAPPEQGRIAPVQR